MKKKSSAENLCVNFLKFDNTDEVAQIALKFYKNINIYFFKETYLFDEAHTQIFFFLGTVVFALISTFRDPMLYKSLKQSFINSGHKGFNLSFYRSLKDLLKLRYYGFSLRDFLKQTYLNPLFNDKI